MARTLATRLIRSAGGPVQGVVSMADLSFDPGYGRSPYLELADSYPGEDVYRPRDFRTEWGPIFHRGRLDGSARVLVVGQDPAAHEAICRRILVGEAGQRAQGLLAKLGITRSYVMVNALLYSVYGQGGGNRNVSKPRIVEYRHRWFDAVAADNDLEAILSLGTLGDNAVRRWRRTPAGEACPALHVAVKHPTYPESASASGTTTQAKAMAALTRSWNDALDRLRPVVTPDEAVQPTHYGAALTDADLTEIPEFDLPAGLPAWMRSLEAWAERTGSRPDAKRATITVTVPPGARAWPPVG